MTSGSGQWQLHRYPKTSRDTLQAWEAADELLHDIITERSDQNPLLVNDQWGALLMPLASTQVASLSDSYVSHCAWFNNLAQNQLPNTLQRLTPLDPLPATTDVVYLKLPKSLSLLEFQLAKLSATLAPGTPLYAAAKSKLFTPSVRALFERYCEPVEFSLIKRKCRIVTATLKQVPSDEDGFISAWDLPEFSLKLFHHAGVFARNQLDIGARFLLEHLPPPGAEQVIDLGCGNGVLGLRYAQLSPQSHIEFVDESYLTIASVIRNIAANLPASSQYTTVVDDCLTARASQSADLILCNPPFHQEHVVTEHIAQQMFRDSKRVLRKNGELWVVANRHLPYYHALKRLFRTVKTVAQNNKFMIYQARG